LTSQHAEEFPFDRLVGRGKISLGEDDAVIGVDLLDRGELSAGLGRAAEFSVNQRKGETGEQVVRVRPFP
jgi:hypothetical protein